MSSRTAAAVQAVLLAAGLAAFQLLLARALPHQGMGGIALVWIIWPLNALAPIVWYAIARRFQRPRWIVFFAVSAFASSINLWIYPQAETVSVGTKFQVLFDYVV